MNGMEQSISENLESIHTQMAAACAQAGRPADSVQLLAVSKTYGPEYVRAAAACGQSCFGENRVQEAAAKIPECPGHLQWHLIGHLQSNKAAQAARLFDWVHSVDSIKLLELLDRHAAEVGRTLQVLIQVSVSGERAKSGLAPEEVPALLERANELHQVEVRGLMTIPPLSEDPEKARPFFRRLRELREEWEAALGIELPELSMGMTHDLVVAIEEGATMVRVGTGIFGARATPAKGKGE
jgi:PLP dependent protein